MNKVRQVTHIQYRTANTPIWSSTLESCAPQRQTPTESHLFEVDSTILLTTIQRNCVDLMNSSSINTFVVSSIYLYIWFRYLRKHFVLQRETQGRGSETKLACWVDIYHVYRWQNRWCGNSLAGAGLSLQAIQAAGCGTGLVCGAIAQFQSLTSGAWSLDFN